MSSVVGELIRARLMRERWRCVCNALNGNDATRCRCGRLREPEVTTKEERDEADK
jgi:ribosomal protein L40E